MRYNARYFVTATDLMTGINDLLSDKGWKAALTAFYDAADPAQPNNTEINAYARCAKPLLRYYDDYEC